MIIRVDTTNLTRGLDFNIIIHTDVEPSVSLYAFSSSTHAYEELDCSIEQNGVFFKANSKAPYFDGYLLAKINSKSMIVKKIGHPTPHFVIGYKNNYTVPYKLFTEDGNEFKSDTLTNIIDGFYYCAIPSNITIMETLKKRFILKENLTKIDYEVTIGNAIFDDVILPNYTLPDITLVDAVLPDITLEDIGINVTLPTIEIKG